MVIIVCGITYKHTNFTKYGISNVNVLIPEEEELKWDAKKLYFVTAGAPK